MKSQTSDSCYTLKKQSPSLFPFQKRLRFIISTPINQKLLVLRPGTHLGLEDRNNVLRFWLELSPRFFSGTNLPCWRKSYAEKHPIWDLLPTSAGRRSVKEWSLRIKISEKNYVDVCHPANFKNLPMSLPGLVSKGNHSRHATKLVQNSADKAVTVPFLKRDSKHRSRSSNSAAGLCQRSSQTHHEKSCLLCSTVFLPSFLPSICNMLRTSVSWNFGDLGLNCRSQSNSHPFEVIRINALTYNI